MELEVQSTSGSKHFWRRWFAWRPIFVSDKQDVGG
jgi:hypothetical protein